MSAYRLCVPSPAADDLVENCYQNNPAAMELKEHRNCLVGMVHFNTCGLLLVRYPHPRLHAQGLCLAGVELQECVQFAGEELQLTIPTALQPYLAGLAGQCARRDLPVFCLDATKDPAAALEIGAGVPDNPPLLLYSKAAIVANLQTADGMSEDEAGEYFEFNILGSWLGKGTPLYLYDTA